MQEMNESSLFRNCKSLNHEPLNFSFPVRMAGSTLNSPLAILTHNSYIPSKEKSAWVCGPTSLIFDSRFLTVSRNERGRSDAVNRTVVSKSLDSSIQSTD